MGAAYLAGARFDVVYEELKKGTMRPQHVPGGEEARKIVQQHDHREL